MEMRPLTREEQLIWMISYFEQQINAYQYNLELAKSELESIEAMKLERGV